jgi:hypothetical protein
MLSETFWAGFYVFGGGFMITIAGLCYRSKCEDVSVCCGMISFKRNIASELKEDLKFGLPEMNQPSRTTQRQLAREDSIESGL